ncbi:MAG TPA: type IV pilus modification protein PilV [Steroidobacteraceae bacterium]|jgi:type IV pilus assembly protein PilV|nr:type IV pilus modification protein PilV [Steroidobacteraceae bacterium]
MSLNRSTRTQRGITLIEVLVALVIMSIGMLGISSLYLETLRANRTAQLRGQAVDLVNDIADRIRANRRGREAYVKAVTDTIGAGGCTIATPYTPADLAKDDVKCWVNTVNSRLPADESGKPPQTSIDFVPGSGATLDRYTVRVQWSEPSQPEPLSYQLVFDVMPPT